MVAGSAGLLPEASVFEEMMLAGVEAGEGTGTVRLPHLLVTESETSLVCYQAPHSLPLLHLVGGLMGIHVTEGRWLERSKMFLPCA